MKKAFTLTETLIALGIIGVVAAIVMPGLITNIEKHRTVSILKRAYRDLFIYVKDFDYINDCNGSLSVCTPGTNEFTDKFSEYLITKQKFNKITKNTKNSTCMLFGGKSNFNCMGSSNPRIFLESPSGYAYGIGANLGDMNYEIFRGSYPKNYTRDPFRAMIWIYTAPNKLKNKKSRIGYDMFSAFVMQSEEVIPNGAKICGTAQPPYGWTYYCGSWEIQKTCNPTEETSSGYGCLSRIIEDGWQINYR